MGSSGRPFIVAHRGASHDAPENTLAAFCLGFEQDADAIECDIHLTRDGRIAVIHDADTRRVAGVDLRVADATFQQLRNLNVAVHGRWPEQGRRETIPSLEEVLAVVPPGKKILIEVKCRCEILPALHVALEQSGLLPEQTVIITFHADVARTARQRFPDRAVQLLCGFSRNERGESSRAEDLVERARGLSGLGLDQRFPIDAAFVNCIKAAGLGCYVWTVDDLSRARELTSAVVDGITSNCPGLLRQGL